MEAFETILSMVLMVFILGIFISFIVVMGMLRAQEFAARERKKRSEHRRKALDRLDEHNSDYTQEKAA